MKELNEPKEELLTDTEKSIVDMYDNFFKVINKKSDDDDKDEEFI
jgi:hypothetical protein